MSNMDGFTELRYKGKLIIPDNSKKYGEIEFRNFDKNTSMTIYLRKDLDTLDMRYKANKEFLKINKKYKNSFKSFARKVNI